MMGQTASEEYALVLCHDQTKYRELLMAGRNRCGSITAPLRSIFTERYVFEIPDRQGKPKGFGQVIYKTRQKREEESYKAKL